MVMVDICDSESNNPGYLTSSTITELSFLFPINQAIGSRL